MDDWMDSRGDKPNLLASLTSIILVYQVAMKSSIVEFWRVNT